MSADLRSTQRLAASGPVAGPVVRRRSAIALRDLVVVAGLALAPLAWILYTIADPALRARMTDLAQGAGGSLHVTLMKEFFLTPWFYLLVGGVLLLERWIPADPRQRPLSRGMRHDFLWVGLHVLVLAWLLPAYIVFLQFFFEEHLAFLRIDAIADWPRLARLLVALLFGDFMFWLVHLIRHHVPALWNFHAVHHSQKQLNFFTEYRVHPLDDLFAVTLGSLPILMVDHSTVTLVAIIWIRHWHTRLYHSNLKTNFGILRYVVVTPQSHRVHHSADPRHRDTNFGLTFSLWDHLFGTQYRGYDEYPETGIDDEKFPYEQGRSALSALAGQLLYPFRSLLRQR